LSFLPRLPRAAALAPLVAWMALIPLASVALSAAGCSTSRGPAAAATGASSAPVSGVSPQAAAPPAVAPAPWQVPAAAYGTQTLYRVTVHGAEGDGSLKLTLRLFSPQRYQAQAADPFGRALWSLDVAGGDGLWLDHRNRVYCRLSGELNLTFLPLGPLSLAALPPLLLGRLPLAPADAASVERRAAAAGGSRAATRDAGRADAISYRDAAGRRWTAVLRDGQPLSWALWPEGTGGPLLSWLSSGGWSVLSDARKGAQVRWRQTVSERMRPSPGAAPPPAASGPAAAAEPATPAAPPPGYREATCGAAPAAAPP
jgi:hypothetical protein